jgi:hypothetical protein
VRKVNDRATIIRFCLLGGWESARARASKGDGGKVKGNDRTLGFLEKCAFDD